MNCSVKLVLGQNEVTISPGTISLLEILEKSTSVTEAAATMQLSYSKAWKLIRQAEKNLGRTLVNRKSVGAGGGKAEITEDGRALIKAFRKTEKQIQDYAAKITKKNFRS